MIFKVPVPVPSAPKVISTLLSADPIVTVVPAIPLIFPSAVVTVAVNVTTSSTLTSSMSFVIVNVV